MKEPVSLDLFIVDVLPLRSDLLVDYLKLQSVRRARHRLLFWLDGVERAQGLGLSREYACDQASDALACLGGLGGVW